MADPRPVNTGFDPLFGDPLQRWRDYLKSQGIDTEIISGVRSEKEHQMAWDNYVAGQEGRTLPHPEFGPVRKATPPDAVSTHDVGLGADVRPLNPANRPFMDKTASQFGLVGEPGDPNHYNLANWQQAAATQAPSTPWSTVANLPSQYARNAEASTPSGGAFVVPGTSLNSNPFVNSLVQIESGNRNIPSTVDKDYPGQLGSRSQGYVQIDTPTWAQFAPKAGVDLSQFPNAMSAPRDLQLQVASEIPLSRFGPRTQNMLAQQYGQLDASKTIGQLASMPPGSASPPPAGGRIGIGSDAVAGGTAGEKAPMTAQDWFKKATTPGEGGKPSPLKAGMAGLEKALGGGDDQGQQAQQQAQNTQAQQLQAQQSAAAYGAQRQQSLAANASQMMAQILAQGKKPLSWGSASPGGTKPGAGAGQLPSAPLYSQALGMSAQSMPDEMLAQLMQQGGSMGTSLNSTGDFYG